MNTLPLDMHPYFAEIGELRVSSHLLVARDGELTQFVKFTDRAWHAGQSNYNGRAACNDFSIGVELEGSDTLAYEAAQYETLANVVAALCDAYPRLSPDRLVGHSDISPGRKTDPGPAFDWARAPRLYFRRLQRLRAARENPGSRRNVNPFTFDFSRFSPRADIKVRLYPYQAGEGEGYCFVGSRTSRSSASCVW